MATYLQGVTDYIPQFQPFQPDLNFYANVMQTKQTQYDTNWKALNKMYGQYYHADLTRDNNISKRDSYLKNIEFQLKRVSQLDLSLEQNVTQATQIFKPFYEDKNLMKDMAWTKNYNNQLGRADMLRNSTDVERRKQYWNDGVKGMNYLRDEFKEATDEDALNFQNAEYVPYVNVIESAQKIAKEAGLSVERVDFSQDGRWIVKTKNGEQLVEPLQKLFEAQLGSDPAVQAVYQMQSYVNRKDYAYNNASQFNDDKLKAEMSYLENSFTVLKEKNDQRYQMLKNTSLVYDNKIRDLKEQIENGTASPDVRAMLSQYEMNKDINDRVLARADEEQQTLYMDESSTATTDGFTNPYGDLKTLRYKVDAGMASLLMQKDLDEAANIFAYKDAETDIEANPYKILEEKQRNSMQLLAAREASSMRVAEYKDRLAKVKSAEDQKIADGTHYRDANGNLVAYENQTIVTAEPITTDASGAVTGSKNMRAQSLEISNMTKKEYLDPYFQNTFAVIQTAIESGKMTKQEAAKILNFDKNKNLSFDQFVNAYNKYGDYWIRNAVGMSGINKIRNNMNGWIASNRTLTMFSANGDKTDLYKAYRDSNYGLSDYFLYMKADNDWRVKTTKAVETNFLNSTDEDVKKYGKYLYDEKGNLRTEAEFAKITGLENKYNTGATAFFGQGVGAKESPTQGLNVNTRPTNVALDIYNKLRTAGNRAYSDPKVIQDMTPVRLNKGIVDPGTGLFTPTVSTITVNPKGFTQGKMYWNQALNDLKTFDWSTDKVSFSGITKTAYDKNTSQGRNDVGRAILDGIIREMNNNKTKMQPFTLKVSPIAGGDSNKAAIIIVPTKEFLDGYKDMLKVKTEDGTSNARYNSILANGISFIMDSDKMTNGLYKSAFSTPLQSYVNHFKKYELSQIDGDPLKNITIKPNNLGTGDYITTMTYPVFDPEKGKMVQGTYSNVISYQGMNLENNLQTLLNVLDENDKMNTLEYNSYTRQ